MQHIISQILRMQTLMGGMHKQAACLCPLETPGVIDTCSNAAVPGSAMGKKRAAYLRLSKVAILV